MVKVGNRNLSVNEARKMLTNWNRSVRESAVKGVWLMTQSQIQEIVNDFTIKGDKVKHKTKAVKWEYDLSDKGKVVPKEMKMKPVKVRKVKKIPEMTKEEEAEGVYEEEPVKTEKKKRKPTAYAVFMGKQRKMGKTMAEIGAMWKKEKK